MKFDYFYEEQSESYTFYRTPKVFFTDPRFRRLSSDAKILYGILLDRVSLSIKNKWLEKAIGRCHQKSCKLLTELENIGLIERYKQGQGKPTRIYVKNFIAVCDAYSKKYERHTQASMSDIPLEVCDSYTNNTDINNTDISYTNPILSGFDVDKDERSAYREYLLEQLDMAIMFERYPYDREFFEEVLNLMLDVICSNRKTIRIAGDDKPVNVVKSQFLKLNSSHLEYVMDCMKNNPVKVRNIKQYLLAALYNAPLTINSYYQAMVNNDMAEGRI